MNTKEKIEFLKHHIDEFVKKGFKIKQGCLFNKDKKCGCPLGAVAYNENLKNGYSELSSKYDLNQMFYENFDNYADRWFFGHILLEDPKSDSDNYVAFKIFEFCKEKGYFVEFK